jgi:hypothetical protein
VVIQVVFLLEDNLEAVQGACSLPFDENVSEPVVKVFLIKVQHGVVLTFTVKTVGSKVM